MKVGIEINPLDWNYNHLKKSINMYVVNVAALLNSSVDVLIVGLLLSNSDLGVYSVASRLAILMIFLLQILNSVLRPKVAMLYHQNNFKQLELIIRKVTGLLSLISLLIFILFILFGKSFLSMWGPEFVSGYTVLLILAAGQLVNVATGPVGLVLIMCGREKEVGYLSVGFLLFSVISLIVLTSNYGLIGSAISFSIMLTLENVSKVIMTNKYFGITIK